jgi:hypothetical protein
VAGAEVTLTDAGVKLNALSEGAVVSVAETTDKVEGKPLPARSLGPNCKVFPAASVMNTLATVQVPASLNAGKLTAAELVTVNAGANFAEAACVWLPEGLTNTAWKELTPDTSSVRLKFTVSDAAAVEVLTEVGVKLNALAFGGKVSCADVTCNVVGNEAAEIPLESRNNVSPTVSATKM